LQLLGESLYWLEGRLGELERCCASKP